MAISREKQKQIIDKRKTQIVRAAMELFDLKGFQQTKISDIAERAGVSKGLIYHYFATKEDILWSTQASLKNCIETCATQSTAADCLCLFMRKLITYPYYDAYIPPIRIIFTAVIQGAIPRKKLDMILGRGFPEEYFGEIFARGQQEGIFRDGDPRAFAKLFWNQMMGCMVTISFHEEESYEPDIEGILSLFRK
jgi:AcrR family transcriptional regulator